jgi:hypothetical protein
MSSLREACPASYLTRIVAKRVNPYHHKHNATSRGPVQPSEKSQRGMEVSRASRYGLVHSCPPLRSRGNGSYPLVTITQPLT